MLTSVCLVAALNVPHPPSHAFREDARSASPAKSERWTQSQLEAVSEEIRVQIEALRGMKFKSPVAVRMTDKKGFLEYARKRQAETMTPERVQRDVTVAKLLGLIPADMDFEAKMMALLEEQVGGFYDPGTNTFYLMESFTGGVAKIILAHELTHALDDQHFDIDGTLAGARGETDAELAFQAVVEGSGTGLMNQWFMQHVSEVSPEDLARAQSMGAEQMKDAPPYLWKPLIAAYLRGDGFLARTEGMNLMMSAAKTEDIRAAMAHPPRSTEQILHPKKYWDAALRDEPKKLEIDAAGTPEGWTALGQDTLGELFLAMLTTPAEERRGLDATNAMAVLGIKYTNEAAKGWGGDRLALYARGDDRLLQLVTCWDTAQDADEFQAAVSSDAKSAAIPVFASAKRDRDSGFVAGASPTSVSVTRETAADGQTACVIVRVLSCAKSADESALAKVRVPWKLAAP